MFNVIVLGFIAGMFLTMICGIFGLIFYMSKSL